MGRGSVPWPEEDLQQNHDKNNMVVAPAWAPAGAEGKDLHQVPIEDADNSQVNPI